MMRAMRENTKWIMLITALAFVALMVFEWGMDITGQSSLGFGEIGTVNGQAVLYDDYMAAYRQILDQVQANQEDPVTTQQNRDIEEAAWDQVVNSLLVQQELRRRGISVTNEEVRQAAQFSPPPAFRNNPAFRTDGQFDLQKYQQFISNPSIDDQLLLQLEAYYRDVIPRGKLLRQISEGIYLSDAQLWRAWRDANEEVSVRFVPLNPGRTVDDAQVEVTRAEVEDYYRRNRDSEFAVPARATVKFAVLPKAPTEADSTAARDRAREVYEELRADGDWDEVAARESSDPGSSDSGGDLGVFARNQMVPAFDSVAFNAPLDRIQEPIQSNFGWHVIEVLDRWGADSARARHILIPVERTDNSEIALLTRADSLETLGEDLPIEEAAAPFGLQVQEIELTTEFAFAPRAGQIGEGADWALEEALPGDVSPVFETRQAFYMLELVSSSPAGYQSLEEAYPQIEESLRFRKKMDIAVDRGTEWVRALRAGASMDELATEEGFEIRVADPFTRDDFVPGLGQQNAAIGTAFGLTESGEVSDVVETSSNAFIIQLLQHFPADSAAWQAQKEDQRARLTSSLERERLQLWLDGLRRQADIRDRRDEVLNADPEEQQGQQFPMGF